MNLRRCLRDPIPEIEIAADLLNEAVSAHLRGDRPTASDIFHETNSDVIREWLTSVWGRETIYNKPRRVAENFPRLPKEERSKPRDATNATKLLIHERDGQYCRFCKMPVIPAEIRIAIHNEYPEAVPWGSSNAKQHAALQCMWAQYDHILPHARGGHSTVENVFLTCAACNYGRGNALLEELDLAHPSTHSPRTGSWDGLARFMVIDPLS